MKTYQLETKGDILQIRIRHTLFNPDGSVRTSKLQRQWISPGQDYSSWPRKVRRHAKVFDTPEAIERYKTLQALDPMAPKPPLVDGETDIVDVIVREDDYVEICKCTETIENGERFEQIHEPVVVPPGVPVSNAPAKVNAMIAAAHIPTVVDRYETEQAYDAEKLEHDAIIGVRNAAEKIKTDAHEARTLIEEEHAEVVLSGTDEEIAMLALKKIEAMAKHIAATTEHNKAVVLATQAEQDLAPFSATRDAARQAYDVFESG